MSVVKEADQMLQFFLAQKQKIIIFAPFLSEHASHSNCFRIKIILSSHEFLKKLDFCRMWCEIALTTHPFQKRSVKKDVIMYTKQQFRIT